MKLRLLRACSAVLADIQEKYPVSGLHVDFARREHRAQMGVLFTGDRLRGMMKRRSHYASDTVCSTVASFSDRTLGFVGRCDLTWMNEFYTEMVHKFLFDRRGVAWMA